jgi:hypothetical protein
MTDQEKTNMRANIEAARRCLDLALENMEAGRDHFTLIRLSLAAQYASLASDSLPRDLPGVDHMRALWAVADQASSESMGQG